MGMDTHTTPAPTTNDILSAFLDSSAPISKVADQLRMSVEDLAEWLAIRAPLIRTLTDVVEHRARFKVFSAELVAVDSLKAIAEADRDPERRRKASTKILCHAAIFRRPAPRQTAGRGADPAKPDLLRTPRDPDPTDPTSPPPTAADLISPKPLSRASPSVARAKTTGIAIAASVAIAPTESVSPAKPRELPTKPAADHPAAPAIQLPASLHAEPAADTLPHPPQPPAVPQPDLKAQLSAPPAPASPRHPAPAPLSPHADIIPSGPTPTPTPTSPPPPDASPQPTPQPTPKPAADPKWPLRPPLHTTRW